jgi:hypothetical protein
LLGGKGFKVGLNPQRASRQAARRRFYEVKEFIQGISASEGKTEQELQGDLRGQTWKLAP